MAQAAKRPPTPQRDLEKENAAAAALKDQLKAILGEAETDVAILSDMIEGETDLFEAIDAVLAQIAMDYANIEGIGQVAEKLAARSERLGKRTELMRTMLLNSLDIIGQKKVERPLATVTAKDVAPKLVITNEADVPSKWWKPSDPTLDRKALTDALKTRDNALEALEAEKETIGEEAYKAKLAAILEQHPLIPGAELGNGSATVQIRFS